MKIPNTDGEFAFRALVRSNVKDTPVRVYGDDTWGITAGYFFSLEEVHSYYDPKSWDIKWPVEVMDNGTIYVPSEEELK